jgi:hypothetical protein
MKYSPLLALGVMYVTNSLGQPLQEHCALLNSMIETDILKSSGPVTRVAEGLLKEISPEWRESDLSWYIAPDFHPKERERLDSLKLRQKVAPGREEIKRYDSLSKKYPLSPQELEEQKRLHQKIEEAKTFKLLPLTQEEEVQLRQLQIRQNQSSPGIKQVNENRLKFYNEEREKIKTKLTRFKRDNSYQVKTDLFDFSLPETPLSPKELPASFDGSNGKIYHQGIEILGVKNTKTPPHLSYDIKSESNWGYSVALNPSSLNENMELNETLRKIVLGGTPNRPKKFRDFGITDSSFADELISDIQGDVMVYRDSKSGMVFESFRARLLNAKGNWINVPKEYVKVQKLSQMLLPKGCQKDQESDLGHEMGHSKRAYKFGGGRSAGAKEVKDTKASGKSDKRDERRESKSQ